MKDIDRAGYLAHASLPAYLRRVRESRYIICFMLETCSRPYVAASMGKDSQVLLHLVARFRPSISARTLTSGETRLMHANFDELIAWWKSECPEMDYQEICHDRLFSAEWETATYAEQRSDATGELRRGWAGDFNGVFLGLRDEESNARRLSNKKGTLCQYSASRKDALAGMWRCCPLARWSLNDIGAYIAVHDIPLLAAYENDLNTRTTARLTETGMRLGGLVELRQRDPGSYNQLISRFPEISIFVG